MSCQVFLELLHADYVTVEHSRTIILVCSVEAGSRCGVVPVRDVHVSFRNIFLFVEQRKAAGSWRQRTISSGGRTGTRVFVPKYRYSCWHVSNGGGRELRLIFQWARWCVCRMVLGTHIYAVYRCRRLAHTHVVLPIGSINEIPQEPCVLHPSSGSVRSTVRCSGFPRLSVMAEPCWGTTRSARLGSVQDDLNAPTCLTMPRNAPSQFPKLSKASYFVHKLQNNGLLGFLLNKYEVLRS